jgi:hypothetical protein
MSALLQVYLQTQNYRYVDTMVPIAIKLVYDEEGHLSPENQAACLLRCAMILRRNNWSCIYIRYRHIICDDCGLPPL